MSWEDIFRPGSRVSINGVAATVERVTEYDNDVLRAGREIQITLRVDTVDFRRIASQVERDLPAIDMEAVRQRAQERWSSPASDPIADIRAAAEIAEIIGREHAYVTPSWHRRLHPSAYEPQDVPSPDAMTAHFDLEPTETCWKSINAYGNLECGEPADPDSETGICAKHREEIRKSYSDE